MGAIPFKPLLVRPRLIIITRPSQLHFIFESGESVWWFWLIWWIWQICWNWWFLWIWVKGDELTCESIPLQQKLQKRIDTWFWLKVKFSALFKVKYHEESSDVWSRVDKRMKQFAINHIEWIELEYFPELISVFRSQLSMRRTVGRWRVAVSRQPRKVVLPPIPLYSPNALSYHSHNISFVSIVYRDIWHTICLWEGQEGLVQGSGSRPAKESKAGAITLEWAAN